MNYNIEEMSIEDAKQVASWRYEEPYSLYNMTDTPEEIEELTDGTYFSVRLEETGIIGYFCYGKSAQVPSAIKKGLYNKEGFLDIGLGMKPELTGQGNGLNFIKAGLQFGKEKYDLNLNRLSVANFNKRAINLYKKVGFKPVAEFINKNGETAVEFTIMEK